MSERAEIKRDGGKPQNNSGRGKHAKGDAILGPFCYDVKEYRVGYTINRNVWGKVCTDALRAGNLEPALKVVLGEGNSKVRLWVISDEMMHELLESYEG